MNANEYNNSRYASHSQITYRETSFDYRTRKEHLNSYQRQTSNVLGSKERPSNYDRLARIQSFKDRSFSLGSASNYNPVDYSLDDNRIQTQVTRRLFYRGESTSRENLKDMLRKNPHAVSSQFFNNNFAADLSRMGNYRLSNSYKSESQLDSCSDRSLASSFETLNNPTPYSFLRPFSPLNNPDYLPAQPPQIPRRVNLGSQGRLGEGERRSNLNSLMFRLTVEDQDTTTASGSKRDYSAEHRSENSPSPLSGGLCTNNSISPHYKSTSKHYNQTGSRNHKIAHDSTSATSTSHPKSDPKDYHHRKEPSSKSRDPSGAGSNTVTLDENVLENCDLYLYYQLGVGNFGVVMQGVLRNLESGKERSVAVKILRCSEGESAETSRQQMLREAKVMSELNHPNVIKLIGIFNGPELMLVSELAPIGQLNKYLKKNKSVPVEMLMNYALQVANGMAYLERKSFVHRDLAARNVLLATDRHARISDFGMSRMLSFNKDYYRANDGGHWPVRWYAPQCIYFFTFTSKSDVWSYGVTLWEIFSYGQRPYGNMRSNEILEMIDKGARLKCPAGCPPEMFSLMLRCWEYEESDRPTFEEIYQVVEIYFRAQASKSRDVYTG